MSTRRKDAEHLQYVLEHPGGKDREHLQYVLEHPDGIADVLARQREMEQWIARQGSEGLKQALQEGCEVTGRYARERAAIEYPGYTVVHEDGPIHIDDRANPSDEAISELKRLRDRVAELHDDYRVGLGYATTPKHNVTDPALRWVKGEVVALSGYLGNYALLWPTDMRGPLIRFTRRMLALAEARADIRKSLSILEMEEESARMRQIIIKLQHKSLAELSLPEAMEKVAPDVFSSLYIALLHDEEFEPTVGLRLCLRELERNEHMAA